MDGSSWSETQTVHHLELNPSHTEVADRLLPGAKWHIVLSIKMQPTLKPLCRSQLLKHLSLVLAALISDSALGLFMSAVGLRILQVLTYYWC